MANSKDTHYFKAKKFNKKDFIEFNKPNQSLNIKSLNLIDVKHTNIEIISRQLNIKTNEAFLDTHL